MMRIYLDNAATTQISPEVIEVMTDLMKNHYGNPSSIHQEGRTMRAQLEEARKTIANHLKASIGEIFFTSGGTEANNMAIKCSVSASTVPCHANKERTVMAIIRWPPILGICHQVCQIFFQCFKIKFFKFSSIRMVHTEVIIKSFSNFPRN